MALGDIYTNEQIDFEIDRLLPILNEGRKQKLPKETVKALLMAENMGNSGGVTFANRVSPAGAAGVAQVMPATLKGLKGKGYLPPEFKEDLTSASLSDQLTAGIVAMSEMAETIGSNNPYFLASYYNAGVAGRKAYESGNIDALPKETKNHLFKVRKALSSMGGRGMEGSDPTLAFTPISPASIIANPTPSTTPFQAGQSAYSDYMEGIPNVLKALGIAGDNLQLQAAAQQEAIKAGGEAAAESIRLQTESQLAEQEVQRDILNALGLDIRDPESTLRTLLTQAQETEQKRLQVKSKVDSLRSVSFLKNPLGFLMSQPELQRAVAEHNSYADLADSTDAQIARAFNATKLSASLIPTKSVDTLRAKAVADARGVVEAANVQLAQSRAQATAGNAKLLMDQLTISRNVFADALGMENTLLGRELQMQNMRDRKETADEKATAKKRGEILAVGINGYRRMLNGPSVRDLSADEVNAMPAEQKGMWTEILARGNFGNSYAQSLPFIAAVGNPAAAAEAGNATMMLLARNLDQEAQKLMPVIEDEHRKLNPMGGKLKSDELRIRAYDRLYNTHVAYAGKGIDKSNLSSVNSPYAIDYDATLAQAMAQKVTGDPVFDALATFKSIAPHERLNGRLTDRQIMDAVTASVVAGKVTPAAAAKSISNFYTIRSASTYMDNGLGYLGLPKLQDYTILPGARGAMKVDLMNPSVVEHYLTSQVASKKRVDRAMEERGGSGASSNVFFPFGVDPLGINR